MAATTTLLGLVTPTQGTLSGTWGDTVNYGISDYVDISVAGTLTLTNDGAVTLANTTGSSSGNSITSSLTGAGTVTAQFAIVKVTGTLTTPKIITGPSYSKTYLVVNAATGSTVSFIRSGQTPAISIAVGESAFVYFNGTDYVKVSGTVAVASFQTSLGGLTPSTATTGVVTLAGTLNTTSGGTGLTSFTAGDVPYYASGTLLSKLAIGTAGQFLTSTGTAPQWSTLSGVAVTTFSAGTTGFTPSSATSGAVTLAGTLGTANGGTNLGGATPFTSGGVVYASSSSALATGSALTFDGTQAKLTANPPTLNFNSTVNNSARGLLFENSGTQFARMTANFNNGDFRFVSGETGQNGYFFTWYVDGTRTMDLTSTGLGIGTSSPSDKLTVAGSTRIGTGTTTPSLLTLYPSASAKGWQISANNYVGSALEFTCATANGGTTFSTPSMLLDSAGNVGIGTSSPVSKLTLDKGNVTGAGQWASSSLAIANPTNTGSYSQISFGYTVGTTNASAYMGFISTNQGTNGYGDLVFGTRAVNTDTQPTERLRIDSAGNVGIGTSSPVTKLEVIGAIRASVASGNSAININNSSLTGKSWDLFPSTSSGESDLAWYYGGTNAGTRMTLSNAGNLGINNNNPQFKLDVIGSTTSSSGIVTTLRLKNGGVGSGDGTKILFTAGTSTDGAGIGSGGVALDSADLQFFTGGNTERMRINAGAPILCFSGGNTSATGTGIAFPATQSASSDANTLDDYEEGTWTPTQGAGVTVIGTFTSAGVYTKIGNLVTVNFRVSATSIGCSGGGELTSNLPFSIAASPGNAMGSIQNSNNVLSGAYGYLTSVYIASVALPATAGAIFATMTYQV